MIVATDLRVGNLVIYNGKPHRVASMMHRTPGNLRGFVQAKLVNIETGSNQEIRFATDDKLEKVNLDEHKLQYSYKAGNDYHFIDGAKYDIKDPAGLSQRMSHRHLGAGSDGIILVLPSEEHDFKMRIFNADGSDGEMCVNGIRCFTKFAIDRGLVAAPDGRGRHFHRRQ